uniref:Uncharacterized protein n=1 Tax=Anguilla anguilla TaxID=7936 RepID=A0A0E9WHA7_ANGAN
MCNTCRQTLKSCAKILKPILCARISLGPHESHFH